LPRSPSESSTNRASSGNLWSPRSERLPPSTPPRSTTRTTTRRTRFGTSSIAGAAAGIVFSRSLEEVDRRAQILHHEVVDPGRRNGFLPCSQWPSGLMLKPKRAANVRCVIPSILRIAFTSTAFKDRDPTAWTEIHESESFESLPGNVGSEASESVSTYLIVSSGNSLAQRLLHANDFFLGGEILDLDTATTTAPGAHHGLTGTQGDGHATAR